MVVLKAVAGLTLLEAPPVFLRPFDHTSTFYEYGQARVARASHEPVGFLDRRCFRRRVYVGGPMYEATSITAYEPFLSELLKRMLLFLSILLRYVR
jgi:hypothetical protein